MGKLIEQWYPLSFGAMSSLAYLIFLRYKAVALPMEEILPTVINLSAIAVGFLATASSILLTMPNRRTIHKMKSADLYRLIIDYLTSATRICFILAALSAILLVIDWEDTFWWHHWLFAGWLFLATTSLLSCYRVLPIFSRILKLDL